MRKDVKRIFIFSSISLVLTIVFGAITIFQHLKRLNIGGVISDDENLVQRMKNPENLYTGLFIAFGFVAILGFTIAFIFNSEDKQYDESLKDDS